jgi:choline dehydrogenase-like flavoprotein
MPIEILVNAWVNDTGLPRLTDHGAGGNNVGCENVPLNIDPKNVTRSTARTGYYDPVSNRENLHLLVRHYVELIEFDANKTAVGINIVSRADQSKSAIKANKEVVLAAGAVNTPKLLQLSGVGPVSLLESLNITVVSDLPGVGANFQDHPAMRMAFNCE